MASTTRAVMSDDDRLKDILQRLLGIDSDPTGYQNDEIVQALTHAKIVGFHNDMTNLTEEDINKLVIPPTGTTAQTDIPIDCKRKLKILLHC